MLILPLGHGGISIHVELSSGGAETPHCLCWMCSGLEEAGAVAPCVELLDRGEHREGCCLRGSCMDVSQQERGEPAGVRPSLVRPSVVALQR